MELFSTTGDVIVNNMKQFEVTWTVCIDLHFNRQNSLHKKPSNTWRCMYVWENTGIPDTRCSSCNDGNTLINLQPHLLKDQYSYTSHINSSNQLRVILQGKWLSSCDVMRLLRRSSLTWWLTSTWLFYRLECQFPYKIRTSYLLYFDVILLGEKEIPN